MIYSMKCDLMLHQTDKPENKNLCIYYKTHYNFYCLPANFHWKYFKPELFKFEYLP